MSQAGHTCSPTLVEGCEHSTHDVPLNWPATTAPYERSATTNQMETGRQTQRVSIGGDARPTTERVIAALSFRCPDEGPDASFRCLAG